MPAATSTWTSPLLDLLFDDAHAGRCLLAPDGSILRANGEWLRLTGFSLDDVLGANFVDLFPEARDVTLALHTRARAGHLVEVPRHARPVHGRETWREESIAPVPMAGGTGLLITTRQFPRDAVSQEAESALRARQARFQTMADGAPVILWVTNAQGDNEFVNRTYRDFFGVTLEEAEGAKWRPLVHPEDAPRYLGDFLRAVREHAPFSCEARVRRNDGAWRWIASYGQPRHDETGEFLGHVGIGLDITDRKRTDETWRRYELLASMTGDIVLFVRLQDGRIIEANAAAVAAYGYSREELLALTISELRAPETLRATEQQMSVADAQGILFETVHRRKDGSTFDVEVRSVGAAMDGVRTLMSVVRDVTGRKRAEEALREGDRRKTEFLGVLSHELRNPLAPIRNSIYLLERAAPNSEQAERAREVIRRQTEHLTSLVDDLLDITRISRGKIALRRTRLDLREIVRKTTDDLHSVFAQAGVELRLDFITLGPVWIDADATRMSQVLGNLLQNSVKFTASGGFVAVSVIASAGGAELGVRDNGLGMEPGSVERMFEPFAQAEQTLARTKGGLGLGLALVKGLVELHGGTVEARSDGIGRGSEFIVRLPLAEIGTEAGREPRAVAEAKPRAILVIEDNLDAGMTLAEILELQGHRVRVARDGRSGLELARELRPDVVLCDIGLPDMDGYEVARALRRDEAFRATRLVALSGYAQPEDRQSARDAGFDAHIAKPPDIDELMRMLANDR